jgi:hypothetical protein
VFGDVLARFEPVGVDVVGIVGQYQGPRFSRGVLVTMIRSARLSGQPR